MIPDIQSEWATIQPFESYFTCGICLNVVKPNLPQSPDQVNPSMCNICEKLTCQTCIEKWLKTNNISPRTGEPIDSLTLPNINLKKLIQDIINEVNLPQNLCNAAHFLQLYRAALASTLRTTLTRREPLKSGLRRY